MARLHVYLGDFRTDDTGSYDMLLVLDVLEHLEDYFAFLRSLKARGTYKVFFFPLDLSVQTVIRPHGLLHTRDAYAHLHYFTKETLVRALRRIPAMRCSTPSTPPMRSTAQRMCSDGGC